MSEDTLTHTRVRYESLSTSDNHVLGEHSGPGPEGEESDAGRMGTTNSFPGPALGPSSRHPSVGRRSARPGGPGLCSRPAGRPMSGGLLPPPQKHKLGNDKVSAEDGDGRSGKESGEGSRVVSSRSEVLENENECNKGEDLYRKIRDVQHAGGHVGRFWVECAGQRKILQRTRVPSYIRRRETYGCRKLVWDGDDLGSWTPT